MKINKFHITNFRSLVDFKIDSFDNTTIFYGLNNAGKSNILRALGYIFDRKSQYNEGDFTPPKNFYEGVIRNFKNNFYNNDESLEINFSIDILIENGELPIDDSIANLFKNWPNSYTLSLNGLIKKAYFEDDIAEIIIDKVKLNKVAIYDFFNEVSRYFPTLILKDKTNASALSSAYSHFIDKLNDCIYIIGSNRDLLPTDFIEDGTGIISPQTFKNNLFTLYLNENKHSLFERINDIFASDPFSFGSISFSKIGNSLEIMVKSNGIRLPIEYLGSSVSQVLFIISSIIQQGEKIVCIEELEQNLSPKLQIQFLVKLQSMIGININQLIISSHSPAFGNTKLSKSIYLVEKVGTMSMIMEKFGGKEVGAKFKRHFVPTALPLGTYSQADMDEYDKFLDDETRQMVEDRFKM